MKASASLLYVAGVGLLVMWLLVPRPGRRRRGAGPVRRALDAAGLPWPPGVLGAIAASSALFAGAITDALTGLPVAGALAACVALPIPLWAVRRRGMARRRAVIDAWPDAIDALVAAVRSGDSLPAALASAAASGPEPLRPALGAAAERARATGNFSGAVQRLAVDLGDRVSRQVGGALALAHVVGGRDLVHVLRSLSAFVREERAMRGELEARQSWTVNAARVAAAGPWAVLLLLSTRADTRAAFAGGDGAVILLSGAVLTFVGYRAMLVLGRLPRLLGEGH